MVLRPVAKLWRRTRVNQGGISLSQTKNCPAPSVASGISASAYWRQMALRFCRRNFVCIYCISGRRLSHQSRKRQLSPRGRRHPQHVGSCGKWRTVNVPRSSRWSQRAFFTHGARGRSYSARGLNSADKIDRQAAAAVPSLFTSSVHLPADETYGRCKIYDELLASDSCCNASCFMK